jgi:two-component system, OmpR family, phosphate regulon response regulator PhoB
MFSVLAIGLAESVRVLLAKELPAEGLVPTFKQQPAEAMSEIAKRAPDLVLLEWNLPNHAAHDFCRTFKRAAATCEIPVLILSVLTSEMDRVVAFELGVDDYVLIPFSPRELMLRMKVALRRAHGPAPVEPGMGTRAPTELALDLDARRAHVGNHELALSQREIDLLNTLSAQPDRVVSREWLRETVWQNREDVSLRSVDAAIKRLRQKLGPARNVIETVWGVGYRYHGPHSR